MEERKIEKGSDVERIMPEMDTTIEHITAEQIVENPNTRIMNEMKFKTENIKNNTYTLTSELSIIIDSFNEHYYIKNWKIDALGDLHEANKIYAKICFNFRDIIIKQQEAVNDLNSQFKKLKEKKEEGTKFDYRKKLVESILAVTLEDSEKTIKNFNEHPMELTGLEVEKFKKRFAPAGEDVLDSVLMNRKLFVIVNNQIFLNK